MAEGALVELESVAEGLLDLEPIYEMPERTMPHLALNAVAVLPEGAWEL